MRTEGFLKAQPSPATVVFPEHFAVLRSLRDELNKIRAGMEGLPRFSQPLPKPNRYVRAGDTGDLRAFAQCFLCLSTDDCYKDIRDLQSYRESAKIKALCPHR